MSIDPRLPDFVGVPSGVNKTADLRRQVNNMLGNFVSKQAFDMGTATITWPGGFFNPNQSNGTVITHTLNRNPSGVLVICSQLSDGSGFSAHGAYDLASLAPNAATIYGYSSLGPAVGVNCVATWIVFA